MDPRTAKILSCITGNIMHYSYEYMSIARNLHNNEPARCLYTI